MNEEFEKMFDVPVNIDGKPMMVPEDQPPEDVDVNWIISKTNEYRSWEERHPTHEA